MIVPFIPFFLVARIVVNDKAWQYGPEYSFDVQVNVTEQPEPNPYHESASTTVGTRLYCRPKGIDTLSCHMENGTLIDRETRPGNDSKSNSVGSAIDLDLRTVNAFDVIFDERGVNKIRVAYKTHTSYLNKLKDIVTLLNIGVNLNGIPDGEFENSETSSVGTCNVLYKVHHRYTWQARRLISRAFEFQSLPALNKVPGEALRLDKLVNLKNCSCYPDYYYGSYGGVNVDNRLDSRIESWQQSIFVTDTTFSSTSKLVATFRLSEKDKTFSESAMVTLSLRGIGPAKEVWPPIENPYVTTIIPNAELIQEE